MTQLSDQSYYEILEISKNADRDEVSRAYHRAKNAYSANSPALYSVFSKEEATEILKMIDEAYAVLINQDRRKNYDVMLTKKTGDSAELPEFAPPIRLVPLHQAPPLTRATNYSSPPSIQNVPPVSHTVNTVLSNRSVTSPRPSATAPLKQLNTTYTRDEAFEAEIENAEVFDGAFLTKIREYKNITIEQISDLTRVGKHYLRALEKNDTKALPAPVFVRGFVVQYAKALHLDDRRVADSYVKALKDHTGK